MAASGSGKGAARMPTGNTVCVPCVLDREERPSVSKSAALFLLYNAHCPASVTLPRVNRHSPPADWGQHLDRFWAPSFV